MDFNWKVWPSQEVFASLTLLLNIESKLPYGYNFIGDQTVKNIAKPAGAYRVLMEPRVTVRGKPEKDKELVIYVLRRAGLK